MATILILDDRQINREFLVTLLGYAGYHMLECADGAAALELTRAKRPDLIICDMVMPTMDGLEFAKALRGDKSIAHIPIIIYTAAFRTGEANALARSCGIAEVLTKPTEPEVILSTVSKVLGSAVGAPAPALVRDSVSRLLKRELANASTGRFR